MSLAPGQTLLHYEILGSLGEGAMGEVWRARDTRLGREVAVKVLPARFAEDEERLRRFEREARSVASLNHPCVAQIHGVDQVDDIYFLVLELVPGENLAERLHRGPLPVAEAMAVCARIADGLEAAHEVGIIHRDLKPANVRRTPDGKIKLLDFGLARPARSDDTDASSSDSALTTEAGRLLGTPTYMAPEQARGRPIDRRVDVWAFGCVFFECLTGKRAYDGESVSDVLAAVLEHEPDWSLLPPLPARVEELLRRCLVKDPRQRLRDVGEARLLLDDPDSQGTATEASLRGNHKAAAPPRHSRIWLAVLGIALIASLLMLAFRLRSDGALRMPGPMHLSVAPPTGTRILFSGDFAGPPVVSPDGSAIVFSAVGDDEPRRLWIRQLGEPEPTELLGTDEARFPFWNPDSREIGYFASNHLCRHDLDTGTVSRVVAVGPARGGAFTEDGRIVYAGDFRSGLSIVDAAGGEPTPLTTVDEDLHTSHRWPSMIAGTDHFLFSAVSAVVGENQNNGVYIGTLDANDPPRRILSSDFSAQYVNGWLLHVKDGSLLAVRLDLDSAETRGRSVVLAKGLAPDMATWHGQFSASNSGVLAFNRPLAPETGASRSGYSWSENGDRVSSWTYDGRLVTTYAMGSLMFSMALSPDGTMLAADALSPDGYTDIWTFPTWFGIEPGAEATQHERIAPSTAQRFTFLPGPEYCPVWSPDGTELVFRWDGDDSHPRGIYRKQIGGGSETLVRDNQGEDDHASHWTPDGKYLVVTTDTILPSEKNDIIAVPLNGGPDVSLVSDPGTQHSGQVSPDGRWLAYVDSNSRAAVFVIPFAPARTEEQQQRRWLVSENGGFDPRWSKSGDELYYMSELGVLIAVSVRTDGDTFSFSTPKALFNSPWRLGRSYDVAPQTTGRSGRFMILDSDTPPDGPISILLGWQALLEDS